MVLLQDSPNEEEMYVVKRVDLINGNSLSDVPFQKNSINLSAEKFFHKQCGKLQLGLQNECREYYREEMQKMEKRASRWRL